MPSPGAHPCDRPNDGGAPNAPASTSILWNSAIWRHAESPLSVRRRCFPFWKTGCYPKMVWPVAAWKSATSSNQEIPGVPSLSSAHSIRAKYPRGSPRKGAPPA